MRLSSLWITAVFILSSAAFAQHSSASSGGSPGGGGSPSGSYSGSSGGGSHNSSASASSSSSSRSSGGSLSHGSGGPHGSSGHTSQSATTSSNSTREFHSNTQRSLHEANAGVRTTSAPSEKRSFFSFLRHPFRRPEPKPGTVTDLRRRLCFNGPCPVCPGGQIHAGGGCAGTVIVNNKRNDFCSPGEVWSGGACLLQTRFVNDCSGLALAMDRQAQRVQAAESAQRTACTARSRQDCSDLTASMQSEASLYRTLQERYRLCQQHSQTVNPFGGPTVWSYSHGVLFDPLRIDADRR